MARVQLMECLKQDIDPDMWEALWFDSTCEVAKKLSLREEEAILSDWQTLSPSGQIRLLQIFFSSERKLAKELALKLFFESEDNFVSAYSAYLMDFHIKDMELTKDFLNRLKSVYDKGNNQAMLDEIFIQDGLSWKSKIVN